MASPSELDLINRVTKTTKTRGVSTRESTLVFSHDYRVKKAPFHNKDVLTFY